MTSTDPPPSPDLAAAENATPVDPDTSSDWIEIGQIVAPQGLRGELRIYPSSDFPERFTHPGRRWLQKSPQEAPIPVELLAGRFVPNKGLYVVRIAESTTRTSAEALRDAKLLVPSSDRPDLEDDEYHVSDLVGLPVYYHGTSDRVGTIIDIRVAGNDILEVALSSQGAAGGRSVLIPFVEAIVPVVDLNQGRVEITPPAGLLDLG